MVNTRSGLKRKSANANESVSKKQKNAETNILDNGNGSGSETRRIDALPIERLVEIIKLLPTTQWPYLERVSRGFREAVLEAWRGLRKVRLADVFLIDGAKKNDPIQVSNSILKKLIDRAPYTTELSAFPSGRGVYGLGNTSIQLLSQFDNLQSVDFSDCNIRFDELVNFLETSRSRGQLKELKMDQFCRAEQRDQVILRSAFGNENSNLPPLKLEKLWWTSRWPFGIPKFVDAMDVSRLTTFDVFSDTSAADLISLITRATNLTSLGFIFRNRCQNENVGVYLAKNSELFKAIATLENLSSLKIDGAWDFDILQSQSVFLEMIEELGRRRRLEEFSLLDDFLCTSEAVLAIANNMGHLKSLELCPNRLCTTALFLQLVTKLKQLEQLRFSSYSRIVGDSLISATAANLLDLKCLTFRYSGQRQSETFKNLARLVNLKELCIDNCLTIDESTMKAWGEGFGSTLESLKLASCSEFSPKGLKALIKKAPRLRKLAVNGTTTRLADHLLREIASSCPDLRKLHLKSSNNKLTTKGVQAIVDGCPRLKRIKGIGNGWRQKVNLEKYRVVKFD